MAGVFISYRRTDGGGWAGRLNDHLALRFGNHIVWQDVDNLEPGKDFLPQIRKKIEASDVVLIVIGPHWWQDGKQRLRDPKDVLRMEIVQALKSKAPVIPTLVGGAEMPPANKLPRAIAGLVQRHGIALSDVDWARSMQFLFDNLQGIVRAARPPELLPDLHNSLGNLQNRYIALLLGGDPRQALDVAREALRLLDQQMPSYPHDHYLQMFRGYFLKNEAMALRDTGDQKGFETSLQEADRAFHTIQSEAELYLANAYNGLGSVTALNGKFKEGLRWIDKALALVPDHPYALHDRKETLRFLKAAAQ